MRSEMCNLTMPPGSSDTREKVLSTLPLPNLSVTHNSGRRQAGAWLSYLGLGEAHLVLSTHTTLIMYLQSLESWQGMAQKITTKGNWCTAKSLYTYLQTYFHSA